MAHKDKIQLKLGLNIGSLMKIFAFVIVCFVARLHKRCDTFAAEIFSLDCSVLFIFVFSFKEKGFEKPSESDNQALHRKCHTLNFFPPISAFVFKRKGAHLRCVKFPTICKIMLF